VEASPDAGKYAAASVQSAHEALQQAERLAEDGKSATAVREAAYLAQRHGQIAQQQIARGQAQASTEEAEAERQRVLLQAREQEAAAREQQANLERVRAEQEAQRARSSAAMLQEQLRELQARETERGLVLTLGDVLFDTGQATLKPGAMSTLDRLAQFLTNDPQRSVIIEGHTDNVGSDSLNQTLSDQRAASVRAALVTRGIDMSRVVAVGKGEQMPVASNDNAAGRQQNRRVEIIIPNATATSRR
jgi:outer membrane protein OmpA-like peptidoglycan-associated protein